MEMLLSAIGRGLLSADPAVLGTGNIAGKPCWHGKAAAVDISANDGRVRDLCAESQFASRAPRSVERPASERTSPYRRDRARS